MLVLFRANSMPPVFPVRSLVTVFPIDLLLLLSIPTLKTLSSLLLPGPTRSGLTVTRLVSRRSETLRMNLVFPVPMW